MRAVMRVCAIHDTRQYSCSSLISALCCRSSGSPEPQSLCFLIALFRQNGADPLDSRIVQKRAYVVAQHPRARSLEIEIIFLGRSQRRLGVASNRTKSPRNASNFAPGTSSAAARRR